MKRPVPRGMLALAGMVAGAAVGLCDGVRAALAVGSDARGAALAALLAASVDALLGTAAGGALEALARVALWGRRSRPTRLSQILAALIVGAGAACVTLAAALGTLDRRNRFLAGGVAALAAFAGAVVGAALLPALARALSPPQARAADAPAPDVRAPESAFYLLAPLAAAVVGVVILWAVMAARVPAILPRTARLVSLAGAEAALLPALLLTAERLPTRLPRAAALAIAACALTVGIGTFVSKTWASHLRFLPWTDIATGTAIVAGVVALALLRAPLAPAAGGRRVAVAAAGAVLSVLLTLATSESEVARKITARAGGLVGPALASARRVLDRDHDGYSRWLGGGDCDDGDPTVHPGVLDFPDDGVDQDCDGKDATVSVLVPRPFTPIPPSVPRDLNLLLVTIDTVRADHFGCYGYRRPTSPAIDALAAAGGLFENGWAHAPSTRYSMPAIATGRWPTAIAWDESIWWPRIAPGVRTIAEALKSQGYFTAAFYSFDYFAAVNRRGFERGVDLYRDDRAVLHQAVNGPMESHGSSSRQMADDAIAFLEQHTGRKFFLWVHFYDPHLSYEPHAEVPSFGTARMDLYDGEIRFTDLHLGRVLERLKALGLWDRTAIVLTGDHGEGFGEHGITEHGFDLYAAQTKVPLIVRVPGLAPRRIAEPAGHVDLAPTLLNLARGPQEPSFLGRSLVPELAGTPAPPPPPAPLFQEVTSERGKKRALVTEDRHLIWNWTPDNTTECYDRRADPGELRDLWGRAGEAACGQLKAELTNMVSALSVPPDLQRKLKGGVFPAGVTAPAPTVRLDGKLGDVVKVVGYSVSSGLAAPGGEVELSILFECLAPVTGGWRLFFHLLGPAGSFRNLDHVPVEGAMPVDRWRPGQRILDRVHIVFPPGVARGGYNIIIGLFRGGERLPVVPTGLSDGNKALRLGTIQIR